VHDLSFDVYTNGSANKFEKIKIHRSRRKKITITITIDGEIIM